jgi:Domain of unknown function (DUF4442)
MAFNEKSERLRREVLGPWSFWLFQWKTLPLAAAAGLRVRTLDEARCTVSLPGGWRTQNPFRSTYFGAQAMAAEMSTGAPAMVLVGGAAASVAMLVREVRGTFAKKIVGPSVFTFDDVASLRVAVDRAAATGEAETFVARSIGTTADGTVAAEFEITWSFKRRG